MRVKTFMGHFGIESPLSLAEPWRPGETVLKVGCGTGHPFGGGMGRMAGWATRVKRDGTEGDGCEATGINRGETRGLLEASLKPGLQFREQRYEVHPVRSEVAKSVSNGQLGNAPAAAMPGTMQITPKGAEPEKPRVGSHHEREDGGGSHRAARERSQHRSGCCRGSMLC